MVIPWLFRVDLVALRPVWRAQTKRKPSANQSANQIPHDVPTLAGRYLRRRKPSCKPNRLSAAIEPGHVCRFSMGYGPGNLALSYMRLKNSVEPRMLAAKDWSERPCWS